MSNSESENKQRDRKIADNEAKREAVSSRTRQFMGDRRGGDCRRDRLRYRLGLDASLSNQATVPAARNLLISASS